MMNVPTMDRAPKRLAKTYSREDMLKTLREAAELVEGPLTTKAYSTLPGRRPSIELIRTSFDTWSAACEAAGVKTTSYCSGPRSNRFDDEVLTESMSLYAVYCRDHGINVSFAGFERWCREYREHSGSLVRARLRKRQTNFGEAMALILETMHKKETAR